MEIEEIRQEAMPEEQELMSIAEQDTEVLEIPSDTDLQEAAPEAQETSAEAESPGGPESPEAIAEPMESGDPDEEEPSEAAAENPESPAEAESDLQLMVKTESAPAVHKRKYPQLPKNVPFVTIDEQAGVETDTDREKNDLLDMVESLKNRRILSDYIVGMERPTQGGEPMAIVYHGSFKVMIPALSLMDRPENTHEYPVNSVLAYLITRRLGSQVDYIITGIDADSGIAVANAKNAMAIKRRRYYEAKDRLGNTKLYEGCLAEARVVSVSQYRVYIELFGVETDIALREISYQRISSAMEVYAPGDRVLVKILSIDRRDPNKVKVTASIKQAQENPLTKAIKKYIPGNYYTGSVSMVDLLGVFVTLDGGGECLCDFPARGRPFIGAKATVKIRDMDLQKNRMWGDIIFWNVT